MSAIQRQLHFGSLACFVAVLAFTILLLQDGIQVNLASICLNKSQSGLAWATSWQWDANGNPLLRMDTSRPNNSICRKQPTLRIKAQNASDGDASSANLRRARALLYETLENMDKDGTQRQMQALAQQQGLRPFEVLALAKLYEASNDHIRAATVLREGNAANDLQVLASIAYVKGRVEDARHLAALAIEANPALAEAYYLLGQINVLYGQTSVDGMPSAIDLFQQGMALQPADMKMRTGLAHALVQAHRYEDAQEQLRVVEEMTPDDPTVHLLLGEVYLNTGNLDEAIRAYETCLSLAPQQVWALYGLGRAYEGQGKELDAIAAWENALRIAPDFKPALQALQR